MLRGVETDFVAVGIVQQRQDPAEAGPVHAGMGLAQRGQAAGQLVHRRLARHADGEVVEAALFKRVVDVAIVGDTEPVDVLGREWAQAAFTAATRTERIAAAAAMGRQIMQRAGALFAVAQQAAAIEPLIAGFWQQGRAQSRYAQSVMWTRMADDGLLDAAIDLEWLIDTASLLGAAETYLLITRMTDWDLDGYERWLFRTWTRLTAPPAPPAPLAVPEPPAPPASG
jgi:hypothetical protein